MTLNEFIKAKKLKVTDALVLRKMIIGMVDHYVLYMGYRGGRPVFIANYKNGVKEVPISDIKKYLQTMRTTRVDRFIGTDQERKLAFNRALSRVGERAYNYFSNNCEHFKNWVHYGDNYSSQVDNVGNVGIGVGSAMVIKGIATENSKTALWGTGIFLAGALLKGFSKNN